MDEKDKGSSTCVKSPEKGSKGENHLVEEENPDGEGPSDTDSTPTKKDTAQDLQTNQDSNDSCVSKSSGQFFIYLNPGFFFLPIYPDPIKGPIPNANKYVFFPILIKKLPILGRNFPN